MNINFQADRDISDVESLKNICKNTENEVCGFLIKNSDSNKYDFIQRKNVHPDPIHHFLIDPKDSFFDKEIIVFHSHGLKCESGYGFSEDDLENQKFFNMPMLLYCVYIDRFFYKNI
jgi:proteasome lid subunit RPN8/RPN11